MMGLSFHLEVDRVHSKHESMQFTQGQQSICEIVDFTDGLVDASHDSDAMLPHRGRIGTRVLPVIEVGLRLRIHAHQSVKNGTVSIIRYFQLRYKVKSWWNSH